MASITDRLAREEWNPQPGDVIVGTIAAITARQVTTKEGYQRWLPIVTVDPGEKGKPAVIVDGGFSTADALIAARPKIGQQIGFKFHGPVDNPKSGKTFDKYTVELEDEPPEPDWDRMAGSPRNGDPGPSEPSDDSW
jgi:hypothetical protein